MIALLIACAGGLNTPPTLETSTLANGETLYIPIVGVTIAVTASDDDGDTMQFRWAIDDIGVQGEQTEYASSTTSAYTAYGEGLDGATLSCVITDGRDEIPLAWPMVYVE